MDASIGSPVARRPLDLGGILSATFGVYRDNYLAFVIILATYLVPIAAVSAIQQAQPKELWTAVLQLVVTALGGALGNAATIYAAARAYDGGRVDAGAAYQHALGRFGSLVGAAFLIGLVTVLLSMTIIGIPVAMYFATRWSMSICAVVLEGRGARAALSRSTELVRGSWWRVFGILFVLGLIFVGIYLLGLISIVLGSAFLYIIQYITGAAESSVSAFASLAATVLDILIGAFSTIGLTILFYDLRTRKELMGVSPTDPDSLPAA